MKGWAVLLLERKVLVSELAEPTFCCMMPYAECLQI